jgi:uncharacterized protein YidB (DUF937 family)
MGALDLLVEEAQSRFGLSDTKATSLLSGLLTFITQQSGGVRDFIDRFKNAGLGDVVSSWFSGAARNLSTDQVEKVLGSGTLNSLASKAGVSTTTASSVIALMLPKLMQSIAPGGAVPTHLPSELMSYIGGPTATIASSARQALYAAEHATEKPLLMRYVWPLLALLGVVLLGLWIWGRSGTAKQAAFDVGEQVRLRPLIQRTESMVRSLVAFGWLRDFVIVLLLLAGNHVRQTSPGVGLVIMLGAAVVFLERFLWSWYLSGLKEQSNRT